MTTSAPSFPAAWSTYSRASHRPGCSLLDPVALPGLPLQTKNFADLAPMVLPIGGSSKLALTAHGQPFPGHRHLLVCQEAEDALNKPSYPAPPDQLKTLRKIPALGGRYRSESVVLVLPAILAYSLRGIARIRCARHGLPTPAPGQADGWAGPLVDCGIVPCRTRKEPGR